MLIDYEEHVDWLIDCIRNFARRASDKGGVKFKLFYKSKYQKLHIAKTAMFFLFFLSFFFL